MTTDANSMTPEEKRAAILRMLQQRQQAAEQPLRPLSFGQRALWFVHRMDPQSPAYNFAFAGRISGISFQPLQQAIAALAQRHPALRTTFQLEQGQPRQQVHADLAVPVARIPADALCDDAILAQVGALADQPFDLQRGPLVRAALFERASGEHVLMISAHHIIADLWSMDIMIRELLELCLSQTQGRAPALQPLTASYQSFVEWEADVLRQRKGEQLWEYWKHQLAGPLPALELPLDHPRPSRQTARGENYRWELDAETLAALKQLAHRSGATMFVTMLAVYYLLLYRLTGQHDQIVGTAVALRGRPEFERVVGYLLNQLPLRTRCDGAAGFQSLLTQVRATLLEALDHQDFPFQQMVERLHPERDLSRTPVFQTMFIWDKPLSLAEREASSAFHLEPLLMEQRGAPFDLTFVTFEVGEQLAFGIKYNPDLFERQRIAKMAEQFNQLARQVAADPATPLDELHVVSGADRKRILYDWNATRRDVPLEPIHEQIRRRAAERPQAVAVAGEHESLTYRELDQQADQLATYLQQQGVGKGSLVGVALPREPQTLVSILAIWKCGAAYLPLALDYPPQRIAFMLQDAAPELVITASPHLPLLGDAARATVLLDELKPRLRQITVRRVSAAVSPADPAYSIYTSGSTGKPKGALLTHGGLHNLVLAQRETFHLVPADRVLQFASLSFDASVFDIALSLANGAALVLVHEGARLGGAELARQLKLEQITIAVLPPSALATTPAAELPELRLIVSAGEACTPDLVAKWAPGRQFCNAYGPTECTVWTTSTMLQPGDPIHIGRPIANTRVHLLNAALEPVPVGTAGQLAVGGASVGLGYLNRPELTAERFVPDPFAADQAGGEKPEGGALYLTGDLGRYRPDGTIEFLGRLDDQVKVRGHRIELGEIEAALHAHPGIQQAAVKLAVVAGKPTLAAYVVFHPGQSVNVSGLREYLAGSLPDYMRPAHWMTLESLPLSPSGKVDRAALPQPSLERPELAAQYVPPTGPVERQLAEVWAAVLHVERVGRDDNFFDLGGHSIQALEVVDRLQQLGWQIAPEYLFQYQTVGELAPHIVTQPATEDARGAGAGAAAEASAPGTDGAGTDGAGTDGAGTDGASAGANAIAVPVAAADSQPRGGLAPAAAADLQTAGMRVESLGVYLPSRIVTTEEVVAGCSRKLEFPLERMTGIRQRHFVEDDQFSYDLALQACQRCFQSSRYAPAEIDAIICCNISRCDGPGYQFSFEPSTAIRLKEHFHCRAALTFDISNACAGFFTALLVAETLLAQGAARRVMVVSGEHITHLTETAQRDIDGFLDPRLASLTLGDSGAAVILDRSPAAERGFQHLNIFTLGGYHDLCVAKFSDSGLPGATMITDSLKAASVAIKPSVDHALRTMQAKQWDAEKIAKVILHQTSETTLDSAMEEFNRAAGQTLCTRENTVFNVAERGNTATTTHWVALYDQISQGKLRAGDRIVFGISGSGQTLGTALYVLDDLPQRLAAPPHPIETRPGDAQAAATFALDVPVEARGLGHSPLPAADAPPRQADTVAMLKAAGEQCFANCQVPRDAIDLVLHAGVYRSEYLSEPALAAIAAGELEINHTVDAAHYRTLAWDLINGGVGYLYGCFVAAQMLQREQREHALVFCSEVENNAELPAAPSLGLVQLATSTALARGAVDGPGFTAFHFASDTDALDLVESYVHYDQGVQLAYRQSDQWERACTASIVSVVARFLRDLNASLDDFRYLLLPQISPAFCRQVADALGVAEERVPLLPRRGNYFTNGTPLLLQQLRAQGDLSPGQQLLMVEVGSGIQVACASYRW